MPDALDPGRARLVDWRFVMPHQARPLRTLLLLGGSPDTAEQVVKTGVADRVVRSSDGSVQVDAVVSLTGRLADAEAALPALRTGGSLLCLIDRRSARGRVASMAGRRRHLRKLGLPAVATYVVRLREGRATLFVPLDVPGAAPWYLSDLMEARDPLHRLARHLLRTLGGPPAWRTKMLSPVHLIVGSKGGSTVPIPEPLTHSGCSGLPVVLMRGDGPWSRVVLLPFRDGDRFPQAVLKVVRTPAHNAATIHEQEALRRLNRLLPSPLDRSVPVAKHVGHWGALTIAQEGFLPGRPMTNDGSATALDRAVGWLVRFHRATAGRLPQIDASEMLDALLVEAHALLSPGTVSPGRLIDLSGSRAIGTRRLPTVWVHGDLTPQNIRHGSCGVTVVDWEASRPGPALIDLLYLLLHWPWARSPTFTQAPGQVFRAVFGEVDSGPARTAKKMVQRYCAGIGMDPGLVVPLLGGMLARHAVERADRVGDSGVDPKTVSNSYRDLLETLLSSPGRMPVWSGR